MATRKNLYMALIVGMAASWQACGKGGKKSEGKHPANDGEPAAQAIEVGKDFSFDGVFEAANDHTVTRHFTLHLDADATLTATESSVGSSCDTMPKGPFLKIDGQNLKRASSATDGYELLESPAFPGQLVAGDYTLAVSYVAEKDCLLAGATLQLAPAEGTPTPNPGPGPVPGPGPNPGPVVDSALVQKWQDDGGEFYFSSWIVRADGSTDYKLTVSNILEADFSTTIVTDTTVSPARSTETVTTIRYADSQLGLHVGDKSYCIYEATATSLKQECSPDAFPAAFTADATNYVPAPAH